MTLRLLPAVALLLSTLCAAPALAEKGAAAAQKAAERKVRDAQIRMLEGEIHQLHEQEKAALHALDQRYHHVIQSMDPKIINKQLAEGVQVLRHVHSVISIGDFDYGGNRHAAQQSVHAATHQLELAIRHDTIAERVRASHDLKAAHKDVSKALAYSVQKYGMASTRKDGGEPETRAAANQQLAESLSKIELAHHLLMAVDHEIKDYHAERKMLHQRHEAEKKTMRQEYAAQIEQLHAQIHALHK